MLPNVYTLDGEVVVPGLVAGTVPQLTSGLGSGNGSRRHRLGSCNRVVWPHRRGEYIRGLLFNSDWCVLHGILLCSLL